MLGMSALTSETQYSMRTWGLSILLSLGTTSIVRPFRTFTLNLLSGVSRISLY